MPAIDRFLTDLDTRLDGLRADGLYKTERVITSPQGGAVDVGDGHYVNLCANNYLGLADHPDLVAAAKSSLDEDGFGMASVRFICGTQNTHKALEDRLAQFLGVEDTILYAACFDANAGLFETLLGPEDAIISDALNHASIIDGVRLCKAARYRYANADMAELEEKLKAAQDHRYRVIATDAVFSMDGYIAPLEAICDLAEKYDAMVMMDDCHGVGFMGQGGRGTHLHCGVEGRIDLITGTFGKALGGAMGGYTGGKAQVVDWLRQRSRPYLFSNALAPSLVSASITALDLVENGDDLRSALWRNAKHFRTEMGKLGFELLTGEHAIVPVMLRNPQLAQDFAVALHQRGVFVTAFSFPVVPKDQDRIRTQMNAAHSIDDLNRAIAAFADAGRELRVIQ
ncbi:MAG: glycine C-acetyltransferase [Pseudomonadota bacterium]